MLVLPSMTMPASLIRRLIVASYGGTPAFEDLRAGGGRHALGDDDVLHRQRHAGQRAEVGAGGARRVDRLGGGERARPRRRAGTRGRRRRRCAIRSRCAWATSTALASPVGDRAPASSAALERMRQVSVITASSVRMRGHPELVVLDGRRAGQHRVPRQARRRPRRRGRRWSSAPRARWAGCRPRRPRSTRATAPRIDVELTGEQFQFVRRSRPAGPGGRDARPRRG